ncbi:hypothetical protein BGZ70_007544 [Mortierella alpina]|uniref:Uncharacterized protein n=1 Tax=Mortierella alpina TaxID=64518 RepID=A0A9P6J7U5_MORAP|nr:hypothetical protein BGZ70_007544 [Mortierella alpina]
MVRKVDQTLRVRVGGAWTSEVAAFEPKPAFSDATYERQHNKPVRLNTAIPNNLESRGLDICHRYPIIAETRAASVDFYTIKNQVQGFLRSRTLEALLGFRAREATAVLSANPPSPFPVTPSSPWMPFMHKESTFIPLDYVPSHSKKSKVAKRAVKRADDDVDDQDDDADDQDDDVDDQDDV